MEITNNLEETLKQEKQKFEKDPMFSKMQAFIEEMQNLGLAKKQNYNIPPVDTIGRKLYESLNFHK